MATGIKINEYWDLVIKDGSLDVGNTDEQDAVIIINAQPGQFREHPTLGVGIINYSASSGSSADLKRQMLVQLEANGFTNIDLSLVRNGEMYNYYLSAERRF
jgi:hypothetical protein